MAKIPVDFSDIENNNIDGGEYPVIITSLTYGQKEDKEYPSIDWKCVISDGPFEGRTSHMYTSFSPKAKFKLAETFRNFGLEENEYELDVDEASGLVLEPDFAGMAAMAVIVNDTYQGRITSNIQTLYPLDGPVESSNGTVESETAVEEEKEPVAAAPRAPAKPVAKPAAAAPGPKRANPFAKSGRTFR